MTSLQQFLALIPLAYLLGSVPFGLIVGLWRGIDPRKAGSGNIGATNVGRLLGGRYFALVFALDCLKGLLPTLCGAWVMLHSGPGRTWLLYLVWLMVGFAAILGHMFSLFLRFKGGKGVATSAGVMLGVYPDYTMAAGVVLLIFLACFLTTRIVSLSSMVAAGAFPILYAALAWWNGAGVLAERWPLLLFAILVAVMVIWKHRGNIKRLRAGTEPRFVKKKQVSHA